MPEDLPVEFIGTEEKTSMVTLADLVAELRALRADLALLAMCEVKPVLAKDEGQMGPSLQFLPLDPKQWLKISKDDLLAAEVSLPLDPACDASQVRSVWLRRPYSLDGETVLVDVSRLPAR